MSFSAWKSDVLSREENLDRKTEAVEKKEASLSRKEAELTKLKQEVSDLEAKKNSGTGKNFRINL